MAAARQEFLQRRAHRDEEGDHASRKEVQGTTTVVIITVFLFAAYFWVIDTLIQKTLDQALSSLSIDRCGGKWQKKKSNGEQPDDA